MSLHQSDIATVGEDNRALRLDEPTMQHRVQHYPAELRDPVLWLAAYVRNECNRDVDLLESQCAKLGVQFTKTTWQKVLRGLWNRDADGQELPSPVANLSKLLKAIELLRKDTMLRDLAGKVPFVMTPTAEAIFHYLDKKRAVDRVNRFGMIVGHTGTQKSASLIEYCRRNNHGTCVLVEAPATPSQVQFITDLAELYGCTRQGSWDRKQNTIRQSVNERRTIIVENVQRLYKESDGGNQKVFNYLQKLQDDTRCTIILTLTPVFVEKLKRSIAQGYFEQFIGRAGGLRDILTLPAHPTEEDVQAIAESFRLRDVEKHLPYLVQIAREEGRVRVLFEALQEGKVLAKDRPLTINHVRMARGED